MGASVNSKKCMKLNNWTFQRGGGLEKIPSVGKVCVWIFSGITQYQFMIFVDCPWMH